MAKLQNIPSKICYTAAGMLIHEGKTLLIHHRKLNMWFCPGGHIDENELPHKAAEREFLEETGLKVRAVDPHYAHESDWSEYLPSPVESNLHWVCEENYKNRTANLESYKPDKMWPKGCEQHLGLVYLVDLLDTETTPAINERESLDIGWFTEKELESFDLHEDIRAQLMHGFLLQRAR